MIMPQQNDLVDCGERHLNSAFGQQASLSEGASQLLVTNASETDVPAERICMRNPYFEFELI